MENITFFGDLPFRMSMTWEFESQIYHKTRLSYQNKTRKYLAGIWKLLWTIFVTYDLESKLQHSLNIYS